jgi:uncharacterized protein (DUF2336 family)
MPVDPRPADRRRVEPGTGAKMSNGETGSGRNPGKIPGKELQFLLDLAFDKSMESRRALTTTIGDLFDQQDEVLSERERALMTDILRKLIHDCEKAVRRDLSERLSDAPNPPHELIVSLANDEIEVAEPILKQSKMLHDAELIGVIRHRTQQHQLAIAMRRSLSEYVSDVLVETGNTDVIKVLLENSDAKISEATMEYLAEESRRVDTYQEPLLQRDDLKSELAERMCLWVSAALRSHIMETFEVDPSQIDDHLERAPGSIARGPQSRQDGSRQDGPEKETPAEALARRLTEQRKVTPDFLVQVLRQGEVPLFEALFGQLSGLEAPRLRDVLYDSGGEGLAIACRAIDMPKPAFATIFLLSRRGHTGKQVVDPRELSRALRLFDKITLAAAEAVMKSWSRGWKYQDAVEKVAEAHRALRAAEPKTD